MKRTNYRTEAIQNLAATIKAAGLRVFVSESGTHGFYTDQEGSRVVSFQYDLGGYAFSGNYSWSADGRSTGTGWRIEISGHGQDFNFGAMLYEMAPRWATRGVEVEYATLASHLGRYQAASRYSEL